MKGIRVTYCNKCETEFNSEKKFIDHICPVDMDQAMGITEMRHEQDVVTPYGTRDEYGGL